MRGTLIAYGHRPTPADVAEDGAWLPVEELEAATGWTLKPEGICRADVCVPIPPGKEQEFTREGRFNVVHFADHMGQPIVQELAANLVVIGQGGADRHSRLATLEAPDFELPDLDGNQHRLSDYRGKKVLLVTWASW